MYVYDEPPTVESMQREYNCARLWLSIQDFINIYPEVTEGELSELESNFRAMFDREAQHD